MRSFSLVLPLPPSVNAMHVFGKGGRIVARSSVYKTWIQYAGISYRKQFPRFPEPLMGRLRAQYLFIFTNTDGDVFNREKCLSDFLQGKLYGDDEQIDEGQVFKRIGTHGLDRVRVWLTEIPDQRHIDTINARDDEFMV